MRKFLISIGVIVALLLLLFLFYFNNTKLVDSKTSAFYMELKDSLRSRGLSASLLVVSTRRAKFHNTILTKLSGAAKNSKHIDGDALDFIVFDVNEDGTSDSKDVEIVFQLLDREIIKDKGGIGKYNSEKSFFYRQMIHIDCRGFKARW